MLCMKKDGYVPGVICTAESIRRSGSKNDILVMVTPDVSDAACELMLSSCTKIVKIPYITFPTKNMKTKRQMELYGSWLSEAYTKWNCLTLTDYQKVLFIDADIIVVQNLDHIFELQAPAGTFSTPWASTFTKQPGFNLDGYPTEHASPVPTAAILKALKSGGYTFIASLVLLHPCLSTFTRYIKTINRILPFGFDNYSTPDEQSLAFYYAANNIQWTHIHQRYNFIVHKLQWLITKTGAITVPHVLHYFSSKKPWLTTTDFHTSIYSTDKIWWYVLLQWHKRTNLELDIPGFKFLKADPEIRITPSKMDEDYFPWVETVILHKFPALRSATQKIS